MIPQLKQKSNGIYYWEFSGPGGERRRISANTRDKAKARALGPSIIMGPLPPTGAERKPAAAKSTFTMRALFHQAQKTIWSPREIRSQSTLRSTLKLLDEVCGNTLVVDVNSSYLLDLKAKLEKRGYAPATVKRKMDAISRVLRLATIWGPTGTPLLKAKPPMPSIRVTNFRDRVLTQGEEALVFAALRRRHAREPHKSWGRMGQLLRWLLDTAHRLGEALQVGPHSLSTLPIRRPDRTMTVAHLVTLERYHTKNDKPRTVPLTARIVAELPTLIAEAQPDDRGMPRLFPINRASIWLMWSQLRADVAAQGADISDVTLHTLRHTCLTRLARGGMDIMRLKEWAGHSDVKTTAERYLHLVPTDLLGGLDILNAHAALGTHSEPSGSLSGYLRMRGDT